MFLRFVALALCFVVQGEIYAVQQIDITRGRKHSISIAINEFAQSSSWTNLPKLPSDIVAVIRNDLEGSKAFNNVRALNFLDKKRGIDHLPIFKLWQQQGANILLNAVLLQNRSKVSVNVVLWDVATERLILSEGFTGPLSAWRCLAHKISNRIYESIIGEGSYFDTKIVYAAELKSGAKRIALMDYDGANHSFITEGQNLDLTPRFSSTGEQILYMSYLKGSKRQPKIHLRDLRTNRDRIVANFVGMSFAPRFSADNTKALISIAKDGATNIFELNIKRNDLKQLTNESSINTSPTYSPSGRIYFNSDRGGSKQIYSMREDGSDVRRITFAGGSYTCPICSPDGKYIAFVRPIKGAGFFLGIMNADGSNEILLAQGRVIDTPCWAPDSRTLFFTRSSVVSGKVINNVYAIDIRGQYERKINTPYPSADPDCTRSII